MHQLPCSSSTAGHKDSLVCMASQVKLSSPVALECCRAWSVEEGVGGGTGGKVRKLVFLSPVNHDGYIRAKHILSKIYKGDILKKYLRVRCLFFIYF